MTASDGAGLIAGRYRLVSEVGSGAMGVVWLAQDERLGRTVAVKELRAGIGLSGTQVQRSHLRARREARIAARLHHPHAVAIFDVAEHDGRPYLVMEYVKSRSLAEVLAEEGRVLAVGEVAEIGAQLASALIAAHEAGIVHRDIKPGNILIAEDGKAKLTDFGISRANDDVTLTGTGEMLGTPAYVAPEVAQGRAAGTASDVFSLGATLYAAVEGVAPFSAPTVMALLLRIVNGEMRPPERIGPLTGTLLWMLRNDPADRPTMATVHRELQGLAVSLAPDANTTPIQVPQSTLPLPEAGGAVPPEAEAAAESAASKESADSVESAESRESAKPAKTAKPSQSAKSAKAARTSKAAKAVKSTGSAKAGARVDEASASPADAVPDAVAVPDVVAVPGSVAVPGVGDGAVASTGGAGKPAGPRRRPPLLWVAMTVAAVLAAGVVAAIAASGGPSGSTTATSPNASSTRAGQPGGSASPSSSAAASTSPVGNKATTSAAASASVSATSPSSSPTDVATQLKSAISNYYQLMPGHLDQAWGYLTTDYQTKHAGGMSGFRSFWDQIQSVKVSDIVAQPPSTVTATIVYSYKDGKTVEEPTSFGLVRSDGIWKIASSTVLSSRTL